MGRPVHRRPAQVDAHLAGLAQGQLADLAGRRVVEPKHSTRLERRSRATRTATARAVVRPAVTDRPAGDGIGPASLSFPGWPEFPRSRRSTASKRAGPRSGTPRACTASTAPPTRDDVFSVDTPPPTVSGSLHIGTIFGYTQFDAMARYQRMRGKQVFFPIGWDDNGLATERRVQNFYGVRCDPDVSRTTRSSRRRTAATSRRAPSELPISRPNFVELCHELTATDEAVFEDGVPPPRAVGRLVAALHDDRRRRAGGSARWRSCATSPAARRTAAKRRRCGTSTSARRSPRPRSRTARSPGAYHRIAFHAADGDDVAHRDVAAGADRQLRRPRRPSRRRALPAAVRHDRAHAAVRRRGPGRRPPARRSRQGHGHRDDLHVRRRHRRHVVARARTCRRAASSAATVDSATSRRTGSSARPAPRSYRHARRPHGQAGAGRHGRGAARVRRADRRAAADHPPREVLRARQAPAGDRRPAGSGTSATAGATTTAARTSSLAARSWRGTPTTCATATTTGSKGSTATG